jgi:hypothetical protein
MTDIDLTEREALDRFKMRVQQIEIEVRAIDQVLARRDILSLAHRTREAIRLTRELLDKNVEILFEGHPLRFHADLYDHLDYAEAHVSKALSDEIDFQAMEKRIYLAIRLSEDVLGHVTGALDDMESNLDSREWESA